MSAGPPGLAFFPWLTVANPLTAGPVRLLPYESGRLPGGELSCIGQQDVDGVLGAYAERPGKLVRHATLLEVDGWRLGTSPEQALPRLLSDNLKPPPC